MRSHPVRRRTGWYPWIWLVSAAWLALSATSVLRAEEPKADVAQTTPKQQGSGDQTGSAKEDKKDPLLITTIDPAKATRGQPVRLSFKLEGDWPTEPGIFGVELDGQEIPTDQIIQQPTERKPALIFKAPGCDSSVPLGRHQISVALGTEQIEVDQDARWLEIVPRNDGRPVKISGVFPATVYPLDEQSGEGGNDSKVRRYKLNIQGDGFSVERCENQIALDGESRQVCWGNDCGDNVIRGELTAEGIALSNLVFERDQLPEKVGVRVGAEGSWSTAKVRLSWLPKGHTLRWSVGLSLGVLLVLIGLALGWIGRRRIGNEYFGFTRLFIDPETETYSLSRFQFFLWTAAAVFGYLHLLVCAWWVQNRFQFLDVPEGLPGIIMISAATTVTAQITQNTKGPKGAGDPAPRFGDLLSVGGVVVPERFQFLLWTLLGALIFVAMTVGADPGTINDLPVVPDRFLLLMGISSAGYLGGKMARNPGPVINQIAAALPTPGAILLQLSGRCLSSEATFEIRKDGLGAPLPIPGSAIQGGRGRGVEPEAAGMEATLFKAMDLTIPNPVAGLTFQTGDTIELTILNPDGQKAVLAATV